jgi:RNA polymerase sigma-70 factor, ECF subfamily
MQAAALERVGEGAVDEAVLAELPALLPRLYSYARYRLPREDAEDAAGAALERVWRQRRKWRSAQGSIGSWLVTVGVNAIRDEVRRHRRRPLQLSLGELDLSGGDPTSRLADLAALNAAISNLPTRDADLIALRYGADLTNVEIAELLGMSPGAVGVAVHRALERLRQDMHG